MADGNRTWARVPHDMGANKIEHLGRSIVADGAARIDDIRIVASGPTDPGADTLIEKVRSPLGTIDITEDTAGHVVDFDVAPASTNGGKLYTAFVPDPLALPSVDAVFHEQGGCDPSVFGTMWTEIASGVWRRNVAGHLLGALTDDVAAWAGMRLFAWSGAVEENRTGPYVLDDIGQDPITHADTYPQMHRAPDFAATAQVLHGAWFAVLGGTAWGPTLQTPPLPPVVHAFRLTNADPVGEIDVADLTWEFIDVPTATPLKQLLTASQLSLASTATVTATVGYVSGGVGGSGELELVVCTQRNAALGGTVLSGTGPFRFHVQVWLTIDDQYADTVVNCYVRGNAHTPWALIATTQPLHNTSKGVFVAVGTLGSDYPLAVGEELEVRYTAVSNSVAGVIVNLTYNDPAHGSYIEIPAVIGYAGTDDHNQLINRFWRGNPTPVLQHDAESMDPPIPGTVTTVAGFLTLPSKCTTVVQLMGTEPLLGISTREGNYSSIPLTLFIMQATTTDPKNSAREPFRVLTNEADMTGYAGFSAMNFGMMGMGPAAVDNEPPNYELTRYSCLQLICLGGTWWPVAPAFVYQSP